LGIFLTLSDIAGIFKQGVLGPFIFDTGKGPSVVASTTLAFYQVRANMRNINAIDRFFAVVGPHYPAPSRQIKLQ
jgi:hypothetical protein